MALSLGLTAALFLDGQDHALVNSRRGDDGRERLFIPYSDNTIRASILGASTQQ